MAIDYSVIDFHGDRVQQYIYALLNIVSKSIKNFYKIFQGGLLECSSL